MYFVQYLLSQRGCTFYNTFYRSAGVPSTVLYIVARVYLPLFCPKRRYLTPTLTRSSPTAFPPGSLRSLREVHTYSFLKIALVFFSRQQMFSATAVEGLVASFFLIKPTIVFVTDRAPQPLSSTIATEELPNINHGLSLFCYVLFFSIPVIIFALLFLSPSYNSRNSNPGSRIRLFPPPPHHGMCLAFLSREDFGSFFPRRLASSCAYPRYSRRSQQLILFF